MNIDKFSKRELIDLIKEMRFEHKTEIKDLTTTIKDLIETDDEDWPMKNAFAVLHYHKVKHNGPTPFQTPRGHLRKNRKKPSDLSNLVPRNRKNPVST